MNVFFYLEGLALHLHLNADIYIQSLCIRSQGRIVCILYITARPLLVVFCNSLSYKLFIQVFNPVKFTRTVYHRSPQTLFVFESERSNVVLFAHFVIICTKGWSNMNYTGTLLSRNKVSGNNSHSVLLRLNPRQKLTVSYTPKVTPFERFQHFIRNQFVSLFVIIQREFRSLRVEVGSQKFFGYNVSCLLSAVRVE